MEKARLFVPTEIHVGTVTDEPGAIGILSILATEGLLDKALDRQAAGAIVKVIGYPSWKPPRLREKARSQACERERLALWRGGLRQWP